MDDIRFDDADVDVDDEVVPNNFDTPKNDDDREVKLLVDDKVVNDAVADVVVTEEDTLAIAALDGSPKYLRIFCF